MLLPVDLITGTWRGGLSKEAKPPAPSVFKATAMFGVNWSKLKFSPSSPPGSSFTELENTPLGRANRGEQSKEESRAKGEESKRSSRAKGEESKRSSRAQWASAPSQWSSLTASRHLLTGCRRRRAVLPGVVSPQGNSATS